MDVIDPVVVRRLRELANRGDPRLVSRLTAMFLEDSVARLSHLGQALAADDRARLAAVAHGLGGSAGALGLNQLSSCCQELEQLAPEGAPRRAAELVQEINRAFDRARTVLEHMCEPPTPGP